jgi:hypothetical protein
MSLRFLETGGNIREKIHFSRYSLIPVCNLSDSEQQSQLYIIDTLYARALSMSK